MKAGFRRQALFSTAVFASILFLVNSVYAQGKQEGAGGRVGTGGETSPAGIIPYRAVFQPQNTVSKLDQLDAGTLTDKEGDLIQGLPDDPPKNKFVLPGSDGLCDSPDGTGRGPGQGPTSGEKPHVSGSVGLSLAKGGTQSVETGGQTPQPVPRLAQRWITHVAILRST